MSEIPPEFLDIPGPPMVLVMPFLFMAVVFTVLAVFAVKYNALRELLVIVCSTFSGFLIGGLIHPHPVDINVVMTTTAIALLLSTAAVAYAHILKTRKSEPAQK